MTRDPERARRATGTPPLPNANSTAAPKGSDGKTKPGKSTPAVEPKPARIVFASHEEYFATQPPEVRALLEWIQRTTESVVPGASRCVSYGMPAFRRGKVFLYFAAFRKHIGIYPPLRGDAALLRDLGPYLGPKGNLSFPLSRPFPKELVERLVIALAAEHGGGKA